MKKREKLPATKQQGRSYQLRPKRVNMGELHYFALTLRSLALNFCRNEEIRQHILTDIKGYCPTLFQAMEAWSADVGKGTPEWDALTFTWKVPLPPAFQEDEEKCGEVTPC
ncbi:MAG TPA: hypothetical protein VEL31_22080 [Ktedonobacteraceae bacterium]|nr:hypothetical protein [Ktedonobacteraceae bacterium]